MKTIPLTQGQVALVDDADYAFLSQWNWYSARGYAARAGNGKSRGLIFMHKVLCPGGEVDHKDGNKANNQKENLRSVSHSLNVFNSKVIGKSGVRGVILRKNGSWRAYITYKGKSYTLGYFATIDEAKEVRRLAEIKYFGEAYEPKVEGLNDPSVSLLPEGAKRKRAGPSTSRFRGVCWDKRRRKWQAGIKVEGKYIYLGHFTDEKEAARAYNEAALKYRGEFAYLNLL